MIDSIIGTATFWLFRIALSASASGVSMPTNIPRNAHSRISLRISACLAMLSVASQANCRG
ncbi:MAG: hypothetical protein AUI16_27375 [Alphaproteobacteria bacterium 13_2_20CM_2_64_7]|nr:MAG: hypothetical protein AUI16_27375 [Alphaproteobacteria bacterium 13_2_20CM_2_64_7]